MTERPTPEVSVVMVVYRTGPALDASLKRVLAEPRVGEFVIVDNGSTPEEEAVQDAVAASDARVVLKRGQGNVGFARGANLGARTARGRDLVFLNPDAFLEPDCVEALTQALAAEPTALVGARVLNEDGTEQRGARRGEVTPVTTLLSLTHLSQLAPFKGFEIHQEKTTAPDSVIPTPTISGACFAMRREAFLGVNGFDERFFLHVEDVDLCWRVRKSGARVLFHPGARVTHLGHTSLKAPLVVEFHKGVGLARYFRKRADTPFRTVLAFALTPAILLVSVARPVLRGRPLRPASRS
jgi:GT2 family glycosyltransferase